ncbi:hypothetical protein ACLKA6_003790 [Drosophila palustris]
MSTAKRLVLSLRGRNNSQGTVATATSSTRLVSAGTSPGHELDEIAVVSGTGSTSHHFTYGGCVGNNNDDAGSAAAAVARYSTVKGASNGADDIPFAYLMQLNDLQMAQL